MFKRVYELLSSYRLMMFLILICLVVFSLVILMFFVEKYCPHAWYLYLVVPTIVFLIAKSKIRLWK